MSKNKQNTETYDLSQDLIAFNNQEQFFEFLNWLKTIVTTETGKYLFYFSSIESLENMFGVQWDKTMQESTEDVGVFNTVADNDNLIIVDADKQPVDYPCAIAVHKLYSYWDGELYTYKNTFANACFRASMR